MEFLVLDRLTDVVVHLMVGVGTKTTTVEFLMAVNRNGARVVRRRNSCLRRPCERKIGWRANFRNKTTFPKKDYLELCNETSLPRLKRCARGGDVR